MDTFAAIRSRRTCKHFVGGPLPRELIEELLDAARWAPTHRLSQPWRFTVLDPAAIGRLAAMLAAEPEIAAFPDPAKGSAKLAKLLGFLPRLGALIQVAWVRAADPVIDLEDHAAASAAVQNLLLAATDRGLASFWSSNPSLGHPRTLAWCGIDLRTEGWLGAVWLGLPAEQPAAPPRREPAAFVRWL